MRYSPSIAPRMISQPPKDLQRPRPSKLPVGAMPIKGSVVCRHKVKMDQERVRLGLGIHGLGSRNGESISVEVCGDAIVWRDADR